MSTEAVSICVVAAQRTGTNLLMSMFPQDGFHDLNEIYSQRHFQDEFVAGFDVDPAVPRELRYSDPAAFVDKYILDFSGHGGRSTLWKAQYQNLFNQRPLDIQYQWRLLEALEKRPEIRILHVVRENLVERYVSAVVAETTGQYRLTPDKVPVVPDPVEINVKACLRDLKKQRHRGREIERILAREHFARVSYEELTVDPAPIAQRLERAFGVPIRFQEPKTLKQGRPISESVRNLDELREALAGTRWEKDLPPAD